MNHTSVVGHIPSGDAVHMVAPAGEDRVDAADSTGTDGLDDRVELAPAVCTGLEIPAAR